MTLEQMETTLASISGGVAPIAERLRESQAQLDEAVTRRAILSAQITAFRSATASLIELDSQIAREMEWRDRLVEFRKMIADEVFALPKARRDSEFGQLHNLKLSILHIDQGLPSGTGYALETLRLGQLMREAGYVAGEVEGLLFGRLPWYGSIADVEHRLKKLAIQRAEGQALLEDAQLDDTDRMRLAAERDAECKRRNALPTRKTRGDGSQYDKWADGREVEVDPFSNSASEGESV